MTPCPQCASAVPPKAGNCSDCGFSLSLLLRHLGDFALKVPAITDDAHRLSKRDQQRLRFLIDEIERQLPQVTLALWIGSLPSPTTAAEAAFWLTNQGTFERRGTAVSGSRALVLTLDPARRLIGLAVGYGLEPFLGGPNLRAALRAVAADLAHGAYAKAAAKVFREFAGQLRAQGHRRTPAAEKAAVPVGLGMTATNELTRRPTRVLTALALAGSVAVAESPPLPLPQWRPDELTAMERTQAPPIRIGELLQQGTEPADPPPEALAGTDLDRFLPPSLIAAPPASALAPVDRAAISLREVDLETITDALARQPHARCIDPHGLLHETSHEQIETFLAYHARDARIGLRLLVIGKHEVLPPDAALQTLLQPRGLGQHECLAIMPMGDLGRTRLFLSRGLQSQVPSEHCTALFQAIDSPHAPALDAVENLRALAVRLSVRLFWLHRDLPPLPVVTTEEVRPATVEPADAVLEEVVLQPPAPSRLAQWLTLGLFTILGLIAWWRWRRHVLAHHEWHLPEVTIAQPRLGGPHAGGAVGLAY